MSEVDLVIIEFEGMRESECVVIPGESHILLLEVILMVRDVTANSMPAQVLILFELGRES